ncbi:nitrate/nitrite transporter [Saccharopolyspora sp. ASAGF58]|uniref:MFS transporter n=1 Tax=Saccharopolyspora sp. ASAGF58 TaxID=2719023 RepID=UPI001FF09015|nr:MFS transporter [Saccharopolyspora sp. ASAGF58]
MNEDSDDQDSADSASGVRGEAGSAQVSDTARTVLVVATLAFLVNFWAWALLAPLAPFLGQSMRLTPFTQALLVALPVMIGSLGRVPVGSLTDRYGARPMFTLLSLLTIIPVLTIGYFGSSMPVLMIAAILLGLGGTTFAIGVPAVNAWFPRRRRGAALGLFGLGTGGTAIASFTTIPLIKAFGPTAPFNTVALALAVMAVLCWTLLRDPADRSVPPESMVRRTTDTLRMPVTWQLAILYALTFGGFVAFSVYLPSYLKNAFALDPADAAFRTAGFVVIAVVARPIGGWLSDHLSGIQVLGGCCVLAGLLASIVSFELPLIPIGTITFLCLAAVLGAGAGAVFALVGTLAPAGKVGAVTGVVGAAGGLGGFFPPLVMGSIYGAVGDYTFGLVLLAATALLCALLTYTALRHRATTD